MQVRLLLDPDTRANIRHDAYFFGGASCPGGQAGWVDYAVPAYFSELPMLIDRGLLPAEVVVSLASPMDEHGYFSLSLAPDYTMAAIRRARVVLLEVNQNVPFANGDCLVHLPGRRPGWRATRSCSRSACRDRPGAAGDRQHVAELIDDGSTRRSAMAASPTPW